MSGIFKSRRMAVLVAAIMVFTLALGATAAMAKGKPGPALTAGATATVTVKVVGYYGGAPLAGVKVGCWSDATNWKASGTTDANGLVTFTGVPQADYCMVSLSLTGYRDSNRAILLTGTDVFSQQVMYPLSSF